MKFSQFDLQLPDKQQTLGIRRGSMPQVDGDKIPDLLRFLNDKHSVSSDQQTVDPTTLSATQGNFNKQKIAAMVNDFDNLPDHPILISRDDYVIDGHHRWLAHTQLDQPIAVIRIDADAEPLIDMIHDFPHSYTKNINEQLDPRIQIIVEGDDVCETISAEYMKHFESFVDKLFKRFNIDVDFTKHFRERMSDERNKPCIKIKELGELIKKFYEKVKQGGLTLTKYKDTEAVIKDLQSKLNLPIAVDFDRKQDMIVVVAKTIMRKDNFTSSSPTIKV